MDELMQALIEIFGGRPHRLVLSKPKSAQASYRKMVLNLGEGKYRAEMFTAQQAFHKSIEGKEALNFVKGELENGFSQLHAWDDEHEHSLRLTKKGKLLQNSRKIGKDAPKAQVTHDRPKRQMIESGKIIPPLIDMGIMTQDGEILPSMSHKFRQINRFLQIIEDKIKDWPSAKPIRVVDLCCGKSYLTFVLYHYLSEQKGLKVEMLGLDLKRQVIENCNLAAQKYGYEGLRFEVQNINEYDYPGQPDLLVALHACDIATDYVLYNAVRWQAKIIFSVPCCQHELNKQIKSENLSILTRYGLVKERFSALLTDSIRANLLEYCGYKAQVMEFVDLEHTPKNVLIRAERTGQRGSSKYLEEVRAAMVEFKVVPTLYNLLKDIEKFDVGN